MVGTPGGTPERPATFFASAAEFRVWLEVNHETETELWMGLNKKHVADRGLTWDDAVPEALCFGWIDSVAQRIDEDSVRQRWTPRKSSSMWSATNMAHVERLVAEGRMRPAGLAAYEKRTPERSGINAYGGQLSDAQRARLMANPAASAFWEIATSSYRKIAENWVATAKREETRESRLVQLIEDSAAGLLIKPQRYGEEPKWVARAAEAARQA
ncbi:MAG: YdeI/OmpD-associated family protein [Nocardioides sp.]|uniref:YdeI/OmpD-associated family protein n=1 Tax=Nocardioides sp. TaxID=35761 RepID=UPI003266862C